MIAEPTTAEKWSSFSPGVPFGRSGDSKVPEHVLGHTFGQSEEQKKVSANEGLPSCCVPCNSWIDGATSGRRLARFRGDKFPNSFSSGEHTRQFVSGLLIVLGMFVASVVQAQNSEVPAPQVSSAELKQATEHLQKGRSAEALELLEEVVKTGPVPVDVALLMADCHVFEGQLKEAGEVLMKCLEKSGTNPKLLGKIAEWHYIQGEYDSGLKRSEEAIKAAPDLPIAHLVRADCLTEVGRLKEADEEYRWFVRYYNRLQPTRADELVLTGRGSAQYARWHAVSQVFKFVVNTLCPDALKDDPNCWQAYWLSGALLLEKYNREDALPELQSALKINPRAADVLAALGEAALQKLDLTEAASFADRALAVNPRHLAALCVLADLALRDGDGPKALAFLTRAQEVNPHEQRVLGRVAAAYLVLDGHPPESELEEVLSHLENIEQLSLEKPSRFSQVLIDLAKRNPHPAYALQILAEELQSRLRFQLAERFYKAAIDAMPNYAEPKTALGLLYMRVGKPDAARKILDSAFDADPFHVRVANMRKVIKLLDGYASLSSDHFVVRVDSEADQILGKYMIEFLEEIYPEITQKFGFEPPARTQFEIYNKAKGMSAHQWFSARMTGLPWIQTIGASTGWIVALASPTSAEKGYNWAKVLKHEFVHIVTLQQTNFNCPHWFTEALAVMSEETPRPEVWTRLLLERVPKGELMNLNTINLGFQRPKTPLDWQMAYCQSHLYASYLVEKYGPDILGKLLTAYREGKSTEQAIQSVCGLSQAEFEKGYLQYVTNLTSKLKAVDGGRPELSLKELRKALEKQPENDELAGQLALTLFQQRQSKEARQIAEQVSERNPREPAAATTLALLELRAENNKQARKILEAAYNADKLNVNLTKLLAKLRSDDKDLTGTAKLYEVAVQHDPDNKDWLRGLARTYELLSELGKLEPVLRKLVELDFDEAGPRQQLAQVLLNKKEYAEAIRYARLALHVDVMNADVHRILAQAYAAAEQPSKAVEEWLVAAQLDSEDQTSILEAARLLISQKKTAEARQHLEKLLKKVPDNLTAKEMLKMLKP